jgi:hypothetical protein
MENKMITLCHEIMSCVCFNDKTIICCVKQYDDVSNIMHIVDNIKNEYDITEIKKFDNFIYKIDDSFIIFCDKAAFDLKTKEIDNYTVIDFLQQNEV